tara:strand:+ start:93 stop:245 length:153 start_codon:yes stop_codon:yes gene_type:complete
MNSYGEPKAVATTIIIKKLKKPKKHVFNGDNKGQTVLDVHGRSAPQNKDK